MRIGMRTSPTTWISAGPVGWILLAPFMLIYWAVYGIVKVAEIIVNRDSTPPYVHDENMDRNLSLLRDEDDDE